MSENASGDWSLLPHNPVGFFGLSTDFDRRDLKRAYGALIRQYKPETHPAEFQRIREAYEQLDSQLRYGVQQKTMQSQASEWQSVVAAIQQSGSSRGPSITTPAAPSVTQTAIENPRGTYESLASKGARTAQDYFVLAVLCDVLRLRDRETFLSWLLAGLKEFPGDAGLVRLVSEYLRCDVTNDVAPEVLLAVAGAAPAEYFFPMTEAVWERVLRERPFDEFKALLKKCEARSKYLDERHRVVFYLRILRAALWKADAAWSDEAVAMLERNGAWLQGAADIELEFVLMLRDYIRHDRLLSHSHATRKQLDEMIEAYCAGDWKTAASAVAAVQDAIARDSHGLMEAFPTDEARYECVANDRRLATICMVIAEDVAPQPDADIDGALDSMAQKQAVTTLRDLAASLQPVSSRVMWMERRVLWAPLVCLVLLPFFLLGLLSGWVFVSILTVWSAAVCGAYFLFLRPKYLKPMHERKWGQILQRAYDSVWRPRLFRYVQACGQSGNPIGRLQMAAQSAGAGQWMGAVLQYAGSDSALYIFSRAQTFVR